MNMFSGEELGLLSHDELNSLGEMDDGEVHAFRGRRFPPHAGASGGARRPP